MTFNSWEFLIFYPIVALLYFVLPKKLKWPMLLIASYYFYAFYQAELLFLIVGTTFVSWISSIIIERTEKRGVKRLMLTLTLVVCLGVLFLYKYFNFLAGSVVSLVRLFGGQTPEIVLNLVLPVGISFYTFQTLSYVIDVYRGDIKTERNFFFYALFVSFFPQLVAGPIERPGNLIPQLKESHEWSGENAVKGAKHMLVGFFKKIVVADLISVYVNAVYNDVESATALGVIIATALFAVQIYCDFSGYTDIAIGCARIMGIRLMKNFDHPYTATSIKEFWGRWHISLSTWFRDYLYIPLGGNRCKKYRHLLNLMIVFTVSGLWHGAAWTYVIWGALHGIYQIVGNLTVKRRNSLISKIGLSPAHPAVIWGRRVITFLLVDFAWLFFRANSIGEAGILLKKLFTGGWSIGTTLDAMGLTPVMILLTVFTLVTLIMIDKMLTHGDEEDGGYVLTKNGGFVLYLFVIMLAWLLLLSKDMASTFIYFQF
ncbi:MAG: MBOAT family protein [Clostridia bacterium]|nr:MBOAT family protein [Clostridia bacterium]